jgi:uncharacterized protein
MNLTNATSRTRLEALVAFFAGLLFAAGLALAGMTQPAKVLAFLDFAGDWDPSLACVMVGAIAVYFAADRLMRGRSTPLLSREFHLPARRKIEPALVFGAALFGVGWGLSGYCPGPALSALGTASREAITFVAAMAVGMMGFEAAQKLRSPPARR